MIILPILTTALMYFSVKGWKNVHFQLGSERVDAQCLTIMYMNFTGGWTWARILDHELSDTLMSFLGELMLHKAVQS